MLYLFLMNKYFIENNTNLIFKIILYLYYFNNYKISNNLYMDNLKKKKNLIIYIWIIQKMT